MTKQSRAAIAEILAQHTFLNVWEIVEELSKKTDPNLSDGLRDTMTVEIMRQIREFIEDNRATL
jgi:hypothetical protein